MPTLERAVTIKAPVERVFDFVDHPENLPQVWPSLYEIGGVKTLPNGGHRFNWQYNMAGKPAGGTAETLEHVTNRRIVDKAMGEIESTFTWTFEGRNGETKVKFEAEYEMQPPYFDAKFERFLAQRNELEADALIANLKARLEI